VILFKKGDMTNIENYRPISLLSVLYKLFTKIITNRLNNKFDFYQSEEQAGFRSGYSTIDHLQTLRALIEKTTEYNIPIHLAFIDFHKAFDSIETRHILDSMDNARIDSRYTETIKNIYANATMHVKINDNLRTNQINIKRGVRQGDSISPKLFTLVLEDIFKKLNWQAKGIKIDGSFLNHLRFADDIVLCSSDFHELVEMTRELNHASKQVGLKMNIQKTKIMSQENTEPTIDNQQIENVSHYIYLGHNITLGKENQWAEVTRRIALTWAAFGKLTHILKNPDIPINLKRKVYNSCILPVTTYGMETMTLTVKTANRFRVTQRAIERAMLNISLKDKIKNEDIRRRTKVRDVIEEIAAKKWRWAGHIARQHSSRWTLRILQWRPRETKRSRGRPQRRWVDDIREAGSKNWIRQAADRQTWKNMEEAYIQKWMVNS
jgi:Reverse transcriptase (RNA-dependent DNA polymerase)